MISLVRFIILSVFITTLFLCGFVASATADQTPVHTQVQKPVLIAELTVPRPSSIFSYCPDGTPLGISYSLRFISIWSCIDISANGQLLLTGDHSSSGSYVSKIWNIDDGSLKNTIGIDKFRAPTRFSPNGKYIFGAGTEIVGMRGRPRYGTGFVVWQVSDGKLLGGHDLPRFTASTTFSPDSSVLAHQGSEEIVLTDFPEMNIIGSIKKVHHGSSVAFSADSKFLAVSSKHTGLIYDSGTGDYIWDIKNNKLHIQVGKEEKIRTQMSTFSNDGSKLATANQNGFDVWDINTGQRLVTIRETDAFYIRVTRSLAFNRDGTKLVRTIQHERTSTVELWDIHEKKLLMKFSEKAPKGKLLDKLEWKNMVRPWDAMIHPELGIILIKYDMIYPRVDKEEEEVGGDPFLMAQPSRTDIPNDLKISIWRLDDMTKLFKGSFP